VLMLHEFGGANLKERFAPVWERSDRPGFALGSLGAFLVLESRSHAEQRGAEPIARLAAAVSDRSRRAPEAVTDSLRRLWAKIAPNLTPDQAAIISGAAGAEPATGEERAFLTEHTELPVRATGTHVGHAFEPQFPMNIGIAALAVSRGALFPPGGSSFERPVTGALRQIVVTGVGIWRGEGMALIEAV
jgi:3-oxoacyl-[acyl-carrier-protein] synthase II